MSAQVGEYMDTGKRPSYQILAVVAVIQEAIVLKECTVTMDTIDSRSVSKLYFG